MAAEMLHQEPGSQQNLPSGGTVITLVHGTFARGAPWTKEGSILRKQFAGSLQDSDVIFDDFEWSGRNTHKARVKAGYELAAHLQDVRVANPGYRHFIVAHSHGGNVALLAHKHLQETLHSLGVATLGTPFIHAKLADGLEGKSSQQLIDDAPRHIDAISSFFGWFVAIVAAIIADDAFNGTSYHAWYWFIGAGAASGIVGGALLYAIWPLVARMFHSFGGKRAALKLATALRFGPMPRTHIASFRYPGDEAGLLLDALETTTKWPTRAIRWLKSVGHIVLSGLFLLFIVAAFITAVAEEFIPFNRDAMGDWLSAGLAYFVIGGLVLWQVLVAGRYVLSFLRGHPAGFGWERPSIHAHVDVGIEPRADVPAAKSNVYREMPFSPGDNAGSGSRHSGLYEDPHVLEAVTDWMKAAR